MIKSVCTLQLKTTNLGRTLYIISFINKSHYIIMKVEPFSYFYFNFRQYLPKFIHFYQINN